MTTAALAAAHVVVAAIWFGAMGYSLGVVQPRAARFFADRDRPGRYEEFAATVAAGARWKVVGVLTVLAASGAGLVLAADGGRRTAAWWSLVGVKVALWLAASALFWRVSWRMWPRRLFALPDEVAAHQRAFSRVGWTLATLAGTATVLGVAATYLPY